MGAIKTLDERILLLGALSLESHVTYDTTKLSGLYEHGNGDWLLTIGSEQEVFNRYATLLDKRFGRTRIKEPPKIWCSWYSLYKEIREDNLLRILHEMDDLPFDVFQIDDGWQKNIGDWEANEKFPSGMSIMADAIKMTGRKAGLWLAPLLVVPSSSIFQNHNNWLLRNEKGNLVHAGVNWSERLYALDTTHPEVLEWLSDLMKKIRDWGYDYVKLDFLYAGALPGKRWQTIPREAAYRHGLETIREALGDAYLLTCGAPILPSLGLCDGIRVGPDVSDAWNLEFESRILHNFAVPGIQNALRTTLNRLWLKPIINTDPDVVYFHSHNQSITDQQKGLLKNLAEIAEFKATSDLPAWLTLSERQELHTFLVAQSEIQHIGEYIYLINGFICDYSEFIKLPEPLNWFEKIVQFFIKNLANSPFVLMIFEGFSTARIRKKLKSEI
ncbi:MAG: glycoside hydrolase family 36 protein [Chloroflexota bacterium]